ncbi:MAG: hypothetical protein LBQ62_08420 [Candidatus Accumulibacter sp.]|nr:hypothetical protein [Accumulibacter sp.]
MIPPLHLAAIVALLSSSALRGATASKSVALRMHLDTLLRQDGTLDPILRQTLEKTLIEWKLSAPIHCDPNRDTPPSRAATPVLH